MSFNPITPDMAGQYLAGGINQAAQSIANGIDQHQITAMDVAQMTGKANAYAQNGTLTADDLNQFLSGNVAKKREIVGKADAINALTAQQFLRDKQQQQLDMEQQRLGQEANYQNAMLGLKERELTANNFTPSQDQLTALTANGYLWSQQSQHGGTALPIKQTGANASAPTEIELPGGEKVVDLGNGKRTVIRQTADKPLNSTDATMLGGWQKQLSAKLAELNEHTTAMANGDNRYGWLNVHSRQDKINELLPQINGLQAQIDALTKGRSSAVNADASAAKPANSGSGDSTSAAPSATAASTAGPTAQGGYQIGKKYKLANGTVVTYAGGDPNDTNNWK